MWFCFNIMLYKVVLTFESVDETLVCDHSVFMLCKVVPTFHSVDKTPVRDQMKLLISNTFARYFLL